MISEEQIREWAKITESQIDERDFSEETKREIDNVQDMLKSLDKYEMMYVIGILQSCLQIKDPEMTGLKGYRTIFDRKGNLADGQKYLMAYLNLVEREDRDWNSQEDK